MFRRSSCNCIVLVMITFPIFKSIGLGVVRYSCANTEVLRSSHQRRSDGQQEYIAISKDPSQLFFMLQCTCVLDVNETKLNWLTCA
jgi:hypothetical protein